MSTTEATTSGSQLRTIPLSAILAIEGWNPRLSVDDGELRALSASMTERGCLVPIRVQATADGQYRIIDGERRYEAAALASIMELPAIVRDAGADEAEDVRDAEQLVDAVVSNRLREQLTPLEEEAAGYSASHPPPEICTRLRESLIVWPYRRPGTVRADAR